MVDGQWWVKFKTVGLGTLNFQAVCFLVELIFVMLCWDMRSCDCHIQLMSPCDQMSDLFDTEFTLKHNNLISHSKIHLPM